MVKGTLEINVGCNQGVLKIFSHVTYEGCSLILVTCLIIFFCGQSMRMLFICGESPIFSDQIGITIIAVRRTVI